MRTRLFRSLALCCLGALFAPAATPAPASEGRLLRFPDIHKDFVVFVHGGDLWRVPTVGGEARRLTAHAGQELTPRISPDGKWIAYTAEYTGSRQVYVMPAEGGDARQLTFYTDAGQMPPRGGFDNWILGWSPEGKILLRMARTPWGERMGRYHLVDPKGGLETPLSLPTGGSASFSPDGKRLAYCPVDREFRTWKRTLGGRAQDVWLYDLAANRSEQITTWRGTDNFPMWHGDTVYFTSDRDRTLNLFAYDLKTRATRKLTHFTEYDVLWPALGGEAIVFMNGGWLYRFDLKTEKAEKIPVQLNAEAPLMQPFFKDVKANIAGASLSPSGARAVFEARGELFTVPAKHGPTRNLTRSQGVRELSPAWSPDGKWIAYLSDQSGEYEIYLQAQDGSGQPRRLTTDGDIWRYDPKWSPDSTKLAFGDRRQRLRILDVATGALTDVDKGQQEDLDDYRWSPDSRWLAYGKSHPSRLMGITLYSLDQKRAFPLGDGLSADWNPTWSADGKHLFFLSNRDFNITFSSFEFDFLYTRATRIFVASLDPEAAPLFPLKSDEEKGKEAEAKDEKKDGQKAKAKDEKKDAPKPMVRLVPEGFQARTLALPGLKADTYGALAATDEALFYVRGGEGGPGALYRFDLKDRKEEKVMEGVNRFELAPDGKKLLYQAGADWGIADAKAGLGSGEGRLDLSGLRVKLEPRAEYRQIFEDGWRIFRDWFYDDKLHGVDWKAMKARYGQLVPFVSHRSELDWIMGEMIGELEAGHTYIGEGDEPRIPRVEGGMLGCDFQAHPSGRYRIEKILQGENWDGRFRSPLTEPGTQAKEGEFLLAIDGVELKTDDNPYRLLEDKAGKPVQLTLNAQPTLTGARQITVKALASELDLRYLDWVKSRMALVNKLSGGRIGYIHLPDTAIEGSRMLQKLFYGQAAKSALIVDDRFNGGGFIPVRTIEYLARKTQALWARRGITSMRSPAFAHDGPKAMLINGYSSSGGDALPYWFRKHGLGPLIGTRTWGGLIGLSGNPAFVDGGGANVPTFRIFDGKGNWIIENEGVAPDHEVVDLPEALLKGGDPSVEKAVELLLKELAQHPVNDPATPVPPVMGKS